MDFELTDDQRMLKRTVGEFAQKQSPLSRFRRLRDSGEGWEAATWAQMGELGWLAVPFPEELGGFGGTFVDAAIILEELGRTLVPEPYLASVILGGTAVARAASPEQAERFLAPMMEGREVLALAWAERAGRYDVTAVDTAAERDGDSYVLRGEKVWVLDGDRADRLVVSAAAPGGRSLFVLDRDTAGVEIVPAKTIDGHMAALVRLDGARVDADRRLGDEGVADAVLDRVLDYGAAACVAEGLGVASAMLWMTVDYLKTREQFGVKIGSFQALQHRAVDMFVETELLKSMSMAAMVRADDDDEGERRRTIGAAKHQLATGGTYVSHQSIQLHGGVGVTDEHDVGLYFKRMHALNTLCGDLDFHVARYAADPQLFDASAG